MSLTYKTESGKIVVRADWGVTRRRVLEFLAEHPWSTQKEIGVRNAQLQRMMRSGCVRRRVGERKHMPYEYATLDSVETNERNSSDAERRDS